MSATQTQTGDTLIIGTGLLGASIGLALTRLGRNVLLRDTSPTALALAGALGAGKICESISAPHPQLVVICVPPDVTGPCVTAALKEFPTAVVTDVASVKNDILLYLQAQADTDISRYVGSHPMAGREKSGPAAADADLFHGRPWVIVGHEHSLPAAQRQVRDLAVDLHSLPVEMDAPAHDQAVAFISHVPQLVASLLAARLNVAPEAALQLAGQGLRDTTRIAHSDPRLWTAILAANSKEVAQVLAGLATDLDALRQALEASAQAGGEAQQSDPVAVGAISAALLAGNSGVERIPGKHGGAPTRYNRVTVLVPDEPGELGRLFSEVGEIGVNIEDLTLEHSPGQQMGLATLSVVPSAATRLETALAERGWRTVQS